MKKLLLTFILIPCASVLGMNKPKVEIDKESYKIIAYELIDKSSTQRYQLMNWKDEFPDNQILAKKLEKLTNKMDHSGRPEWQKLVTNFCKKHNINNIVLESDEFSK